MNNIYKKLYEISKEKISLKRDTKAYNYKYATLDQIQSKLNPILDKLNLIVLHNVENGKVITKIVDVESGEFVQSEIEINTMKPQDKGSEITYYRRYNLLCLLDLEVEDDDGKKAQDSKVDKFPGFKKNFGEKEFKSLSENKSEYVDHIPVLQILDEKGYSVSKEWEQKIKDLFIK